MATNTSAIRSWIVVSGCRAPRGTRSQGSVTSTASSTSTRASRSTSSSTCRVVSASTTARRAAPTRLPASALACGGCAPISRLASDSGRPARLPARPAGLSAPRRPRAEPPRPACRRRPWPAAAVRRSPGWPVPAAVPLDFQLDLPGCQRLDDRAPSRPDPLAGVGLGLRRLCADLPVGQCQRRPVAGVRQPYRLERVQVRGRRNGGERLVAPTSHLGRGQGGHHLDRVEGGVGCGHGWLAPSGRGRMGSLEAAGAVTETMLVLTTTARKLSEPPTAVEHMFEYDGRLPVGRLGGALDRLAGEELAGLPVAALGEDVVALGVARNLSLIHI